MAGNISEPPTQNGKRAEHGASFEQNRERPQGIFLTAEWKNLAMFNYAVDPRLLERFVPSGTELDLWEGTGYLSLVGFEFNHTRVSGVAVPFHRSFEEVNLRFYVKRGKKRGVTFIRELVPRRAVAMVARRFFNENYSCVPMAHRIRSGATEGLMSAEYFWGSGAGRCSMRIEARGEDLLPSEGSHAQFITEHYWGYAAQPDGGCIEYEVQHPQWRIREANAAAFSGDAVRYYGELGATLGRPPDSAFLIEGSTVTIFRGRRIH
ncbi:MAG TPA: DUF2071 domain-containing protein [Terracidiphilus sp.]|nr:DUF2071 domain-containing protein [Terracidiphilus sp.]